MDLVAGKISRLFDPHRSRDDVKPQEQRCDVGGESDAVRRVIHAVTPATFVDANRSVCRPEVSQQDCELLVCQTERIAWHTLLI